MLNKLNSFCLILIIVCGTSAIDFNEFCVGVPNESLVSHPSSCSGFIWCWNGLALEGDCGDQFYFNPEIQECDWPTNVDCDLTISTTTPLPTPPPLPTPSPTTTPAPPPSGVQCPESGSILLAHPQSCSVYILCFGGAKTELECPSGKHFSEEHQSCIDPEEADCTIDSALCDGKPDFQFIPSTVDCNEYFICLNSTAMRRNCAPELHFNPIELRCETQQTAGCLIIEEPEPQCPPEEPFVVIPHPTSCTEFFNCFSGVPVLQECAPGLLFDPIALRCDLAANVECNL